VSNGRPLRRNLVGGLAGLAALQGISGLPAAPTRAAGAAAEKGPVIWTGSVPGATADSVVFATVQRVDRGELTEGVKEETALVGWGLVDARGVVSIEAEPGEWFERMADRDGRVEVLLTASAEKGRRFGVGLTTVLWSPSEHRWNYDPEMLASGALEVQDPKGPPSSPITMIDATPEMLRSVKAAAEAGRFSAHRSTSSVPVPPGYACYGGASVYTGSQNTAMSLGKYAHSGVGPSERFTYQRTTTTSSEWGFKVGSPNGTFTASGRITLAQQQTSSAVASSVRTPDGHDRKYSLNVEYQYERRQYTDCYYAGEPPACGGRCGWDLNLLRPYKWTGNVSLDQVGTDVPTGGGTDRTLAPGNGIGRANGESTTVSQSAEVGVNLSVLSASLSYTTSGGSGTTVTRFWENNFSSHKYINGRAGDPQFSGTANVWAHG